MARTSKSRGKTPFSMRSGNRSTFKMMGSSPMRIEPTEPTEPTEVVTMGEEKVVKVTKDEGTTTTDYERPGEGYTPPSKLMPKGEWDKLSQDKRDAMDAKYIKAHTRDILEKRQEVTKKPEQKKDDYTPRKDLTSERYRIERVGIGTHTYPKGDDNKPLVRLKDNAGRVIFEGSQTDYETEYGKHLTRGGADTQVGNKKDFLYTRSVQEESKGKYGSKFKSSAVPKKKAKGYKIKRK